MASTRTITIKRVVIVWIASYLVALNAIVAAFAMVHGIAGSPASGTASVICHGAAPQTPASGSEDGGAPDGATSLCCGVCALANAGAIIPRVAHALAAPNTFTLLEHTIAIEIGIVTRPARSGLSRAPPQSA